MTKPNAEYLESVEKGLKHVRGHATSFEQRGISNPVALIEAGKGSREGCIRGLESLHSARAVVAWFGDHDLAAFKQESYVASKLRYIRDREFGCYPYEQDFFPILCSDHEGLLRFAARHVINNKEVNNPNKHLFRHYQMSLALRGEWEPLGKRAEQQLSAQPHGLKRFMVDQRFYLALAHGDKQGMTDTLAELTSPKVAKVRNDQMEFGYTHFFIGTHATMYAKIAWRAGYQVEIDTPFIPREWLPMQPLERYEDPYPFMRAYDTDSL